MSDEIDINNNEEVMTCLLELSIWYRKHKKTRLSTFRKIEKCCEEMGMDKNNLDHLFLVCTAFKNMKIGEAFINRIQGDLDSFRQGHTGVDVA